MKKKGKSNNTDITNTSWYLPNSQNLVSDGPYQFAEVVNKIFLYQLHMDDFVWGTHLPEKRWYRLFELECFQGYLEVLKMMKLTN